MANKYDLAGKKAVVTGAGSARDTKEFGRVQGLGSAIARALVMNGADIVFTYNRSEASALALRDELRKLARGRAIHAVQFNAANYAIEIPRLLEVVPARDADILVNNLGASYIVPSGLPHDEPAEEVENLMCINFFASYELSKRVAEQMMHRGSGGYIINISSCSLFMPHARRPAYGMTKHALHGMLREFASYYGPHAIKVIELQLGIFETVMTLPRLGFYRDACNKGAVPIGRLGRPEEVGELIAFIVSGACDYLHGAEIRVDGGLTIRSFDLLLPSE